MRRLFYYIRPMVRIPSRALPVIMVSFCKTGDGISERFRQSGFCKYDGQPGLKTVSITANPFCE